MRCIEDNLRFHQHHKIGVVENLIMQRLSGIVIPDGERCPGGAGGGDRRSGNKWQTETAGEGFRGVEQCTATDANHHAAVVTGLSRQLLYIAFAAMTAKQNMLCPWKSKRWRKFGLRRSNGAFAVDPHRARKLFISEKIVQVIETSWM